MSSVELSKMHFETIGLEGKYKELIGDPSVGFSCMVYGKPKSGKSTMCIDFAKHLAENHGKVLYAAIEEGFGYTTKEKIERLNAVHQNLFIGENIPSSLSSFDFVFIDSVSKGKVDNEKLNELITQHPKTAFIFIFHATKEGDFRGGQENAHDVDCIVEVKDGVASGKGRFGVGGSLEVF
jgi:predicted ATP-dependent serine protease